MGQTITLEAEFFFQQGLRQLQSAKYEAAIACLDSAIKCEPHYPDALSQRGFALGNLGRHEEAIASFDYALSIQPDASWV